MVRKPFNADCSGDSSYWIFKLVFCSYLFVALLVFLEKGKLYISFRIFNKLATISVFPCSR